VKATLLKALEEDAEPLTTIPHDAVWIVDAMAILQATKTTTIHDIHTQNWHLQCSTASLEVLSQTVA